MGSALDRLKKAANLKPTKRSVTLSDDTVFEFFASPLTMAERERAQKDARSDDINQFALQLLISKAKDEAGRRLFTPGDLASLKNDVRDDDLQSLMVAIVSAGEEENEQLDLKSTRKGSGEG